MPGNFQELLLVGLVAMLYSSVGHAGASGYIAVLTLAGWESTVVRPFALVLNIVVAAITTVRFYRAGYFRYKLFIPLIILSIPAAFVGGAMELPKEYISRLLAAALFVSAGWMITHKKERVQTGNRSFALALGLGGCLGFLAGCSGTGGGIFLSPLLYFFGWASLKEIAAIAAPYILVNSVSGLLGFAHAGITVHPHWLSFVAVSSIGGYFGSTLGANSFSLRIVRILLALVLTIAGIRLL